MNLNDIHSLVKEFPYAIYRERDINTELAKAFDCKGGFETGTSSELKKRYQTGNLNFIIIVCANNVVVSFSFDHDALKYLLFLVKEDEVFEYHNFRKESWISSDQFNSFEGLNMISVAKDFCNGKIDGDTLEKVTEGFSFDSFSLFLERERAT